MPLSRRHVLKSGAAIAASIAGCPRSIAFGDRGNDTSDTPDIQSWTIENNLIRREVAFHPGHGLFTSQFSDKATSTDLLLPGRDIAKARPEFSFNCNGTLCAGNSGDFELLDATPAHTATSNSLSVRLKHKSLPLEVTAVYSLYTGHAASRKSLRLKNTGLAPLRITHLAIETLEFALGPENELTLFAQYGAVPREIFYTGRSEDAGIMLLNARTGHGLAILNEVPGYMKRTEVAGWDADNTIRVSAMYDTDIMPFERRLAPGEQFTTASISILPFRRDDGLNDSRWRVPGYTASILERRLNRQGPPWIYNTWEPFERGINQQISMDLIDAAGAMGIEDHTLK